jgi:lipopolysaccharide/colanic/teichoic acid biosynthesis glycosyltransferase
MEQIRLGVMNSELFGEYIPVTVVDIPSEPPEGTIYDSKRVMDILLSGTGLVATLPITIPTAAAIVGEGLIDKSARGPIFYSQERPGYKGNVFKLHKFRSMKNNAHEQYDKVFSDGATYDAASMLVKPRADPRVTRIGAFIRKYGIDELPQLWNIFKGEMSMVGPRPYEKRLHEEAMNNGYGERYDCLPGLTGELQLNRHRYENADNPAKIMDLDIKYVNFYKNNYTVWRDMRYVVDTIGHVVSGKHV